MYALRIFLFLLFTAVLYLALTSTRLDTLPWLLQDLYSTAIQSPKSSSLPVLRPYPWRTVNESLLIVTEDRALAFTGVLSDTARHASNMIDIMSSSGLVSYVYAALPLINVQDYLYENGYRHHEVRKLLLEFEVLRTYKSPLDAGLHDPDQFIALEAFPFGCWGAFKRPTSTYLRALEALSKMHHLFELHDNATDFSTRLHLTQDFRVAQRELQGYTQQVTDDARVCYGKFHRYISSNILPKTSDFIRFTRNLFQLLNATRETVQKEFIALPWYHRHILYTWNTDAVVRAHDTLQSMYLVLDKLITDAMTIHKNYELMARYASWLEKDWEAAQIPTSLDDPPDLDRLQKVIDELAAAQRGLQKKSILSAWFNAPYELEARKSMPNHASPVVLVELGQLGLWP